MKNACYTEVIRASKNLLLIFNTSFTKTQEFGNQTFDWVRLSNYFFVSSISFDWRTQSILIHGLSSIEFDWVRLKFSSIGFDWLCRVLR